MQLTDAMIEQVLQNTNYVAPWKPIPIIGLLVVFFIFLFFINKKKAKKFVPE